MNDLLDVNVLVAWGWADHADHRRVAAWIGEMKAARGVKLVTSAIPELGFLRVSVQRTGGHLPVAEAARVLSGMIGLLGKPHLFLPDDSRQARDGRNGVGPPPAQPTPILPR